MRSEPTVTLTHAKLRELMSLAWDAGYGAPGMSDVLAILHRRRLDVEHDLYVNLDGWKGPWERRAPAAIPVQSAGE